LKRANSETSPDSRNFIHIWQSINEIEPVFFMAFDNHRGKIILMLANLAIAQLVADRMRLGRIWK